MACLSNSKTISKEDRINASTWLVITGWFIKLNLRWIVNRPNFVADCQKMWTNLFLNLARLVNVSQHFQSQHVDAYFLSQNCRKSPCIWKTQVVQHNTVIIRVLIDFPYNADSKVKIISQEANCSLIHDGILMYQYIFWVVWMLIFFGYCFIKTSLLIHKENTQDIRTVAVLLYLIKC